MMNVCRQEDSKSVHSKVGNPLPSVVVNVSKSKVSFFFII